MPFDSLPASIRKGITLSCSNPGVFTAGYASSAVVQAIVYVSTPDDHGWVLITSRLSSNFWGYFEPIRQNMPANCSADVEAVITHVDSVIGSNDTTAISALKSTFGLPLGHNDDFAAARTCFLTEKYNQCHS